MIFITEFPLFRLVLSQITGQLSPSAPIVRDDTLKSSQDHGAESKESAQSLFSSPATDECWRKFLESYAEYLKGNEIVERKISDYGCVSFLPEMFLYGILVGNPTESLQECLRTAN